MTVSGHALALSTLLLHTAAVVQHVREGRSLTEALSGVPDAARGGTQALAFHTLRRLGLATALRQALSARTPRGDIDALLTTSLALLSETGERALYADHTVVNQAVQAARRLQPASANFVNAVLRRFLRERDAQLTEAREHQPQARFNHPAWWVEQLGRDWPAAWQPLLQQAHRHPPMTLRVNTQRGSVADYLARLSTAGLSGRALGPEAWTAPALQTPTDAAIVLDKACPVHALPGFDDGDVSVQDAAAQIAAPLLLQGLPRGQGLRVLDACAAPGGKTAHLLELADLDVLALDRDATRLLRVNDTLARLKLNARTVAADAGDPRAWWDAVPFDAILLDAPCSASGIVRRHPDVRWLRRQGDIAALAKTQARLLDALWPLLKPGGRLLYSACSVFKAEGQDQIDAFLQRQPDAQVAEHPHSPGHLLPVPDNEAPKAATGFDASPDGFFHALLQKN